MELLEERGIMTQGDVLKRMKEVRDRKKVSLAGLDNALPRA